MRPSLAGPFLGGSPLLWAEHRDPPVKDQGLPQRPVCCWEVLWVRACSIHGALHSLTRYKHGCAPCDARVGSSRRLLWGLVLVSPPCLPAAAGAVVPFMAPPLPHSDTKEPWLLPGSSGSSRSFPWSPPFPPLFKLPRTGPGSSIRRLLNSQQGDKRAPGKPSSERLKLRNNEEESSRRAPPPPGGSAIDFQDMQFPVPLSLGSQRAPWRKPFPCPDPVFLSGLRCTNSF